MVDHQKQPANCQIEHVNMHSSTVSVKNAWADEEGSHATTRRQATEIYCGVFIVRNKYDIYTIRFGFVYAPFPCD